MEKKSSRLIIAVRLILAAMVLANIIFIWGNSAEDGAQSRSRSDKVVDIVEPIINKNGNIPEDKMSFYVRKGAHFSEYALLGGLSSLLYLSLLSFDYKKIRAHLIAVPLGVAAIAGIDETIQKFYDRTSSIKDVALDSTGGIFGILVAAAIFTVVSLIAVRIVKKRKCQ